jgi:hypothetical protein
MFYAIFDNQFNEIRHFGLNSISQKNIKNELIAFLLDGCFSEQGDISIRKSSLKRLLNGFEFTLLKSKNPFPY